MVKLAHHSLEFSRKRPLVKHIEHICINGVNVLFISFESNDAFFFVVDQKECKIIKEFKVESFYEIKKTTKKLETNRRAKSCTGRMKKEHELLVGSVSGDLKIDPKKVYKFAANNNYDSKSGKSSISVEKREVVQKK